MLINELRATFINFFAKKNHIVIPSSSLIPKDDPSLLFTTAGMLPFKNFFTNLEKPLHPQVVSCQKCLRAGGKHNDLENVGYSSRHHTFFEMLGNFSFGDYFKKEAIEYAWQFLTKTLAIDPSKLLITVFADDEEAKLIWHKVSGLSDSQIIKISTKDNFWSMGDTGPCGPCSEIFYDYGDKYAGKIPDGYGAEGERFVEIWNLVFMQYNCRADGTKELLAKQSIDTGAGLERLAAVLQGVHSNYEIDLFARLMNQFIEVIGNKTNANLAVYRIIADHLRASCFILAEGILPSNEGRGYVLRRIMRRAMRHIYMQGYNKPIMHKLAPYLIAQMGDFYPELTRASSFICDNLYNEEEKFKHTLSKGLKLLENQIAKHHQMLPGNVAFKLYDTYGFPLDLTEDILREKNMQVDVENFNHCMQKQRKLAKKFWIGSDIAAKSVISFELLEQIPKTKFLGYNSLICDAKIKAIIVDNAIIDTTAATKFWFITDQTTFYAEAGGQLGDIGECNFVNGKGKIVNCVKMGNELFAHHVELLTGLVAVNEKVALMVNHKNRQNIKCNHSATHLLHFVLRNELSSSVIQKGSLVAGERLRFDFSYNQSLSYEQIILIEQRVNALIQRNIKVDIQQKNYQTAVQEGATALFGEKYPDNVRVVSFDESIELCGGTHVNNTGEIGCFHIIKENAISAGVRRIEAVTKLQALSCFRQAIDIKHNLETLLKSKDVITKLQNILAENKQLKKKLSSQIENVQDDNLQQLTFDNYQIIIKTLTENNTPKDLKPMCDNLVSKFMNSIIIVGINYQGKGSIAIAINTSLLNKYNAVKLVNIGAKILGGHSGGGRSHMAQAGGNKGEQLFNAYKAIVEDTKG